MPPIGVENSSGFPDGNTSEPRRRPLSAKLIIRILTVLTLLFVAVSGASAQAVLSDKSLVWNTDRRLALSNAKSGNKPIMIYLYNRRALACRDMEQETFRDPVVVELMKKFELVAIDVNAEPEMRKSLNVLKVPTGIFYNSNGVEAFRAVGGKDAASFADYLKAMTTAGNSGTATTNPGGAAYNPSALSLQKRNNTMTQSFQYYAPSARKIVLAGDFNDWSTDLMAMRKQTNGMWRIDLYLPNGIYEYKFIVDGDWKEDPNARFRKHVDGYNTHNSVVVIGQVPQRPFVKDGKVTFLYYSRDAKEVTIAGTFTNWQPQKLFAKGDGNFGIQYDLPRGSFQYKFIVDGEYKMDPGNLLEQPDGTGTTNSLVIVN